MNRNRFNGPDVTASLAQFVKLCRDARAVAKYNFSICKKGETWISPFHVTHAVSVSTCLPEFIVRNNSALHPPFVLACGETGIGSRLLRANTSGRVKKRQK